MILVSSLFIVGCDLFGVDDPIYGTWVATYTDAWGDNVEILVLSNDNTWSIDTTIDGIPDESNTGTFTYTETTIHLIGVNLDSGDLPYTLDGDSFTLMGIIYTRQ